jgi:hypothetical protein
VRSHLSRGKVKEILSAAIPAKYIITGSRSTRAFRSTFISLQ